MALKSININIDPHVKFVQMEIELYFFRFTKYLIENEEQGISIFINEPPESAWLGFIENYKERMKNLGFGLNSNYKHFELNKKLFYILLNKKKELLKLEYLK